MCWPATAPHHRQSGLPPGSIPPRLIHNFQVELHVHQNSGRLWMKWCQVYTRFSNIRHNMVSLACILALTCFFVWNIVLAVMSKNRITRMIFLFFYRRRARGIFGVFQAGYDKMPTTWFNLTKVNNKSHVAFAFTDLDVRFMAQREVQTFLKTWIWKELT